MAMLPKRVKYRKSQRGSRSGNATRGTKIAFGAYALQVLGRGWIKNNQIEAARIAITRNMKRKGKLWIRVFPDKSVSKRPPETRMGKGKGAPEFWVAVVKPGNILFEVDGLNEALAKECFRLAANKLPIRTRFINRTTQLGY
jgi:large subunit ribosomal protein L16